MNINMLKYVITVAEEKNMTKASSKLFISQPSLSQSIQALENELGVALFERGKSSINLTYAGEIYIEWAKQTLLHETQMKQKLAEISSKEQRRLIIGVSQNRRISYLADMLSNFYENVNGCSIVLEEHNVNKLMSMLQYGKINLLIDLPNPNTIQYTSIPIFEEKILLAVPKSFNLEKNDTNKYASVKLEDLKDKPIIMLSKHHYLGGLARNLFFSEKMEPKVIMECNNIETSHVMVSKGIGYAFVPELSIKAGTFENVEYFTIENIPLSRTISVVHRNDYYLNSDAKYFIDIMKSTLTYSYTTK